MPTFHKMFVGVVRAIRILYFLELASEGCTQRTMWYLLRLRNSVLLEERDLNQRKSLKCYSKSKGLRLILTFVSTNTNYQAKKTDPDRKTPVSS